MSSIEQIRDDLAGMMGWKYIDPIDHVGAGLGGWEHPAEGFDKCHPIPERLDEIAAMMPEGWLWHVDQQAPGAWLAVAHRHLMNQQINAMGATEQEARLRCLHALLSVLTATKGATHEK